MVGLPTNTHFLYFPKTFQEFVDLPGLIFACQLILAGAMQSNCTTFLRRAVEQRTNDPWSFWTRALPWGGIAGVGAEGWGGEGWGQDHKIERYVESRSFPTAIP